MIEHPLRPVDGWRIMQGVEVVTVARAQRSDGGGAAGRVAARRRDAPRDGRGAARSAPKAAGRAGKAGKRGAEGGTLKRGLRLFLLMGLMALIGFFAVLVVDVSASLVGKVSFGETTLSGLWDKVVDRVLDRDVPRLPDAPKARTAREPARRASPARAPTVDRAPVPAAPRPEDDAKHVEQVPRSDPQVEQAQKRLDDLLKRL